MIQADGIQAVGESFQQLGRITGEEIVKNTEVKQQLNGLLRYVDLNKMVTTFLTPDIWNKLGVLRGGGFKRSFWKKRLGRGLTSNRDKKFHIQDWVLVSLLNCLDSL